MVEFGAAFPEEETGCAGGVGYSDFTGKEGVMLARAALSSCVPFIGMLPAPSLDGDVRK
jgi:hypothetical protein